MIRTIIFDLGGVYFEDGATRFVQKIVKEFHVPEEQAWDVIWGELGHQYRRGEITSEEFWREAKMRWGIDIDTEHLSKMWIELYKPIEGTVKIVSGLRKGGYELFFSSDNIQERVNYLQSQYHFMHHFDGGVFSHLLGTRKPDVKMYTAVLEKTSSQPSQCVFIDNKEVNLAPARKLGMQAILFKDPAQLTEDLQKLELKF